MMNQSSNILVSMPTNLLATVMGFLPLNMMATISRVSKEMNEKANTSTIWAHLFESKYEDKPELKEKVDWKLLYKRHHVGPLSMTLNLSTNMVSEGSTLRITITLKNNTDNPLAVIVGYNHNYFHSGKVLRTSKDSPKYVGKNSHCSTSSCATTVEKEATYYLTTTYKTLKGQKGLLIAGFLGHFLPLTEEHNEIWAVLGSGGQFIRSGEVKETGSEYWKGNIRSNVAILTITDYQTTP